MADTDIQAALRKRFPDLTDRPSADLPAFDCPQEQILEVLGCLKTEFGFDMLMDVTAIDAFEESPRFIVVYHLFSTAVHSYIRIATACADDVEPKAASVVGLWLAADWHERETYDMFGIEFVGHPDLRRILMWDSYPYFPLRKEFPLAGHEVELPAPDVVERTGVKVKAAPMMGGPFHSPSKKAPMSRREPRADDESWTEIGEKDPLQATPDQPRDFNFSES